jgi:sugar lactone lactonase YvrE
MKRKFSGPLWAGIVAAALWVHPAPLHAQQKTAAGDTGLPKVQYHNQDKLEIVHEFRKQMPVGVAVTSGGRVFVSYPRWEDPLDFTLAELKDGREVPYPAGGALQKGNTAGTRDNMVSLQGIFVDGNDRLWALDTGTVNMKPVAPFTPKLICIDTAGNKIERTFTFPKDVVPEGSYINDLRIDLTRGDKGTVYITDSGEHPGIVVVDIASGNSWRRLTDHESVKAEPGFVGFTEGRALFKDPKDAPPTHLSMGSDGIAISPDGKTLYYTPLASRKLFSVSTDVLANKDVPESQVQAAVKDLGEKGVADGMGEDAAGHIYTTNWEQNAILERRPDGTYRTVLHDPRLLWPDTLFLTQNGTMYLISNQLQRQGGYNDGKDLRQPPYLLVRFRVGESPVVLGGRKDTKSTAASAAKK